MKKIFLTGLVGVFLTSAAAQAVGLSVSPREIKVSVGVGQTASREIKVKNISDEVALFEVYPDDLESIIKISPASFFLESGQSREAKMSVSPREKGIFKTVVSVAASPAAGSSFNAEGGVKIPVEVMVGGQLAWLAAITNITNLVPVRTLIGIVLILALGALLLFFFRFTPR